MTADEIRRMQQDMQEQTPQTLMLFEIAAQLADIKEIIVKGMSSKGKPSLFEETFGRSHGGY